MARKVFISVLGAGNYSECKYTKENFTSEPVQYIQEASLDYLLTQQEWNSNDAAYILLTDGAKQKHWDSSQGLCTRLNNMRLPFEVHTIENLPMGNNETEIWEIFTRTFEQIQQGDTLYIDITHGFRYLPMLVVALINYSKFLKKTTVASITYGNFEARNRETNEAQIIDLSSLSTLLDWNYAAGEFINNGNATPMKELSDSVINPIMRYEEDKRKKMTPLRQFLINLSKFIEEIRTCRGKDLINAKSLKSVYNNYKEIEEQPIAALTPLFERIIESIAEFNNNGATDNFLVAARWCYERGMYQQALTLLREGVITIICEQYNLGYITENERKPIEDIIYQIKEKTENEKIREKILSNIKLADYTTKLLKLISDDYITHEFSLKYDCLTTYRNDFNHSGMRKDAKSPKDIKEKIECLLSYFEEFFSRKENAPDEEKERILLNFTNHPSSGWSREQKAAAAEYGTVVDIPFPAIDENADTATICSLAEDYKQRLQSYGNNKEVTIHIMGEHTLIHSLLCRMQSLGYRCIASTTNRIVEEQPDGSRNVKFCFCKFREYETI